MTGALKQLATKVAWHWPGTWGNTAGNPVVLTYHGIPAAGDPRGLNGAEFERQVTFLKTHFTIVPLADAVPEDRRSGVRVALSFDDGFRNNATVVAPILRRHRVPATFFVSSRHVTQPSTLWFVYLRLLGERFAGSGFDFRGRWFDTTGAVRQDSLRALRQQLIELTPHPSAIYDAIERELPPLDSFTTEIERENRCAGLTVEQLRDLAADPLFTIGGHTVDHPLLTRCDAAEAHRQMAENKAWLESVCQRSCDSFAYPRSDFDGAVMSLCRRAGFKRAYSDHRQLNVDPDLERTRTGVYRPSLDELGCKVRWSGLIVRLRQGQSALTDRAGERVIH